MTVVSVLRLPVRPGAGEELARRFAELQVFERAARSGGFRGGRLLRSVAEGAFLVLAEWERADDYRTWVDSPARAELSAHLGPLLLGDPSGGELFEEVLARR